MFGITFWAPSLSLLCSTLLCFTADICQGERKKTHFGRKKIEIAKFLGKIHKHARTERNFGTFLGAIWQLFQRETAVSCPRGTQARARARGCTHTRRNSPKQHARTRTGRSDEVRVRDCHEMPHVLIFGGLYLYVSRCFLYYTDICVAYVSVYKYRVSNDFGRQHSTVPWARTTKNNCLFVLCQNPRGSLMSRSSRLCLVYEQLILHTANFLKNT